MFHVCDLECGEYKDKDHPVPDRWKIGEWGFVRCPLVYVTTDAFWWIRAYKMCNKGLLPFKGTWLEQTNKFIDVMNFIDNSIEEHKSEQRNKNG